MTRPTVITICGQPFAVEWIEEKAGPLHDGSANQGTTSVEQQRIMVRGFEQGPDQERDTVLHEVIHAALKMTAQGDRLKSNEEPVVYALTTALLAVLRENPELVGWLTEELP